MSGPRGYQHCKFGFIIFILTAASFLSAVAGFGSFQIKLLALNTKLPSAPCPDKQNATEEVSCATGNATCSDRTTRVKVKACLAHHQLPPPLILQCTLGQEELILSSGDDEGVLRPEAVMAIPFSYSWPGGFTLSVTTSQECPAKQLEEIISSIVIADYVFPSQHWTSFLDSAYSSGDDSMSEDHSEISREQKTDFRGIRRSNDKTVRTVKTKRSTHSTANIPTMRFITDQKHTPEQAKSQGDDNAVSNLLPTVKTSGNRIVTGLRHAYISETIHSSQPQKIPRNGSRVSLPTRRRRSQSSASTSTSYNDRFQNKNDRLGRRTFSEIDALSEMQSSPQSLSKEDTNDTEKTVVSAAVSDSVEGDDGSGEDKIVLSTKAVVRSQGNHILFAVRVVCKENYYGKSCSRLCRPRNDMLGHYRCSSQGEPVCLKGWKGQDCTQAACSEKCLPTRGLCSEPFTCNCRHGWYGEHCERCRTRPGCVHGTCHLPGQCVCHKGWVGPLCDVEELFCLQHRPCQNGGTCLHDKSYNYTCACPSGYTGTHCEVPVCHKNFCLHGGECQVAEGTRYCLCPHPFAGPRCQHRIDVTSIQTCRGPPCSFKTYPTRISDMSSETSCVGANCGRQSSNSDPCLGYLCYNGGNCTVSSVSNTPVCECIFPFSGPQCLHVSDPCDKNPCRNKGTCTTTDVTAGTFKCACASGYSGDFCDYETSGPDSRRDVCDENIACQNGGKCQRSSRDGQYFCECPSQYTGEFCEIDNTDPCSAHICLKGGTCVVDQTNQPTCICDVGYAGSMCQNYIGSVCSHVTCQNGGTCIEHDAEFVCMCRNRYEGRFCENKFRRKKTTLRVRIETSTRSDAAMNIMSVPKIMVVVFGVMIRMLDIHGILR